MKTVTPLQRGMACLCCRKRKMKCDGLRPVCTQCLKTNRGTQCFYHEKKHVSRTQILQQKVAKLEARLRELEQTDSSASSSSSSSSPPSLRNVESPDPLLGGSTSPFDWDSDISSLNLTQTIPTSPVSSLHPSDAPWAGDTIHLSDGTTVGWATPGASSSTANWWEDRTSFCQNKQQLLEIFFAHRHQCAFDVHLARFRTSLQLAAHQQPHPALMDAVYLMGCYFSRLPQFTELEPHFLKRALAGISEALHQQDRMVQVLQASSLIAVYFFCQGRVLEGYYHSSTSARLAIDVGLHQIRPTTEWQGIQSALGGSSAAFPADATFPLPPVKDPIEHAERVAAFWQIFIVDRAWSVATGLPSALPDDDHPRTRIATSWPMGIADMSTSPQAQLGLPDWAGSSALPSSGQAASNATLRAKAVMLFERTARFASSSRSDSDWAGQRSLEMSLAQFSANLPGVNRHANQFAPTRADVDLVTVHILVLAASIHLHRDRIEADAAALEKCVYAAGSVAALVRELAEDDYAFLDPINGTCWRAVTDVYARMLGGVAQMRMLQYDAAQIASDYSDLLSATHRLAVFFPAATLPCP